MLLVVEDDAVARRALSLLLRARGFETYAAGSAEQAMQWITQGNSPHCAVIDLELPGMNGVQFIQMLRLLNPNASAILVSAAAPEQIVAALGDLVAPILQKPINVHHLLDMIGGFLKREPPDPAGQIGTMPV